MIIYAKNTPDLAEVSTEVLFVTLHNEWILFTKWFLPGKECVIVLLVSRSEGMHWRNALIAYDGKYRAL